MPEPEVIESAGQLPTQGPTISHVGLRVRELPAEELGRLRGVLSAYRGGVDSRTARVVVAENEAGMIVATWGVFATVHIEPLWIAESHRKHPGVIRALWEEVWKILETTQQKVSFAIMEDTSEALPLARRLKFERIKGSLYWVRFRRPRGRVHGHE